MSAIIFNNLKSFDGRLTEQKFNRLVDAMQSLVINQGLNYTVARTPVGTTLGIANSSTKTTCPFTIILKAIPDDDANVTVNVSPGTVNQYIATNAFDDFTISKTGLYYVKAGIETDGQSVSSVTLYVDTDEADQQTPAPFALPSSFDIVLGVISDGKPFRAIGCGSIILSGYEQFRTDKDEPAEPGELTYTPYYVWKVEVA